MWLEVNDVLEKLIRYDLLRMTSMPHTLKMKMRKGLYKIVIFPGHCIIGSLFLRAV